ncbi:MAG TPA: YccF domain-containing protein [Bacteroidaceae bacterium]|nr:YccF domain-containing protein [Bacteroidaceae bacterium]
MKFLGNIIWLLFGGLVTAIEYFTGGIVMMATIIGIPFGFQMIKIGSLCLWPFGRTFHIDKGNVPGCLFTLLNIIWFLLAGLWIALTHVIFGCLLFITIIGIPWGIQHFKLAGFAVSPFGRRVDIVI